MWTPVTTAVHIHPDGRLCYQAHDARGWFTDLGDLQPYCLSREDAIDVDVSRMAEMLNLQDCGC